MIYFDLSCMLEKGTWCYGNPYVPYEMEQIATVKDNGYITHKQVMTSHTGTHLENGRHWWDDADGVEKLCLNKVVGNAKVLRFQCNEQPFYEISADMLKVAGAESLKAGDICIISTGWDKRIEKDNYTWESPYITVDAARYLKNKKINAFAIDTPMFGDPRDGMDYVPAELELPDYIFSKSGIPCILGLVNVDKIPDEVFFIAAPLKLKDADGSPVRAMAITF